MSCSNAAGVRMDVAERLTDSVTFHGEGPFWDDRASRLLCVDVLEGVIVAIDSDDRMSRHDLPSPAITTIRHRAAGGFVVATERGVATVDDAFGNFRVVAELTTDPLLRTNDGGCDPFGNFIIGTMAYDESPLAGKLYSVGPDGVVTELAAAVSISNGVQWSADGSRAFYVDTPTRRVDVFDLDPGTGAWGGRRSHLDVSELEGYPDGMAIDEEDGLWIAFWGAGIVRHFDSDGRLAGSVRVPGVTQSSSCAFGGEGGSTLYITTSRKGLGDAEPDAGALFAFATDARGAQPYAYQG